MVATSFDGAPKRWEVFFHDEFDAEFDRLESGVQDALIAAAGAIELLGPKAGRPHVDTLHGSQFANMKELRFTAKQGREVWRAAFAFDPDRCACILVAGAKQGRNQQMFYGQLVRVADRRFASHLAGVASRDNGFAR
ncbi:type II toxin-antitoxin system RelE/ParE family toxin [Roseateles sp. MS654]|uniref:type II toxin-antitoxin system RelE/ParE family toxin n=1 Tax=Roseateles sp. MS654 TaxID=3412685 RepID=UPI003C2CFAD2